MTTPSVWLFERLRARLAASDSLFLQLKMLEVQQQRIEKWDGRYPSYLMQMGASTDTPNLLIEMPKVTAK